MNVHFYQRFALPAAGCGFSDGMAFDLHQFDRFGLRGWQAGEQPVQADPGHYRIGVAFVLGPRFTLSAGGITPATTASLRPALDTTAHALLYLGLPAWLAWRAWG